MTGCEGCALGDAAFLPSSGNHRWQVTRGWWHTWKHYTPRNDSCCTLAILISLWLNLTFYKTIACRAGKASFSAHSITCAFRNNLVNIEPMPPLCTIKWSYCCFRGSWVIPALFAMCRSLVNRLVYLSAVSIFSFNSLRFIEHKYKTSSGELREQHVFETSNATKIHWIPQRKVCLLCGVNQRHKRANKW